MTGAEVIQGPIQAIDDSGSGTGDSGSDSDSGPGSRFGSGFVGLVDTSSFATETLISDPVASGSDHSSWTGECPPDDQDCKNKE